MRRPARTRLVATAAALSVVAAGLGTAGPARADTTLSFQPVADAQVYSSHLTTNYGTLTTLRTREGAGTSSDPTYRTYLRFDVSGVSGAVTGVTLRLSASDPSSNAQGVYAVAAGWTETGVTYDSAPVIGGTPLGSASVPASGYNDIALAPSSVSGNGSVWLGIKSAGTNSAIFDSREGAAPPLLLVTVGGSPPPPVKPVAAFSGSPRSGSPGLTVTFGDASTNGPTSWVWDFGDPSSVTNSSTLQNPSHTYADPGTYDVTLVAANSAGPSDPLVKTGYVTVTSQPPPVKPVAAFSGSPRSGGPGLTVAFSDASTNAPTSWTWDFGDPSSGSNSSTLQNPSHTYADPGTYDVTLVATNSAGSSDPLVKTGYVTVTSHRRRATRSWSEPATSRIAHGPRTPRPRRSWPLSRARSSPRATCRTRTGRPPSSRTATARPGASRRHGRGRSSAITSTTRAARPRTSPTGAPRPATLRRATTATTSGPGMPSS